MCVLCWPGVGAAAWNTDGIGLGQGQDHVAGWGHHRPPPSNTGRQKQKVLEPRGLWAWKVPAVVMESHRCPAGGREGFSLRYLRYAGCTDKLAQTQLWLVVEPQFLLCCWAVGFHFYLPLPHPYLWHSFPNYVCSHWFSSVFFFGVVVVVCVSFLLFSVVLEPRTFPFNWDITLGGKTLPLRPRLYLAACLV